VKEGTGKTVKTIRHTLFVGETGKNLRGNFARGAFGEQKKKGVQQRRNENKATAE